MLTSIVTMDATLLWHKECTICGFSNARLYGSNVRMYLHASKLACDR